MKVRYDQQVDVLYIKFRECEIEESDEIRDGVIIDFDAGGKPVGIEILNASEILDKKPEVIVEFPKSPVANIPVVATY